MMKFIGKPYAGKPHVRIDEGAGKALAFPALLYRKISVFSAVKGLLRHPHDIRVTGEQGV
jgi:hypothetical protein